MSRIGGTSDLSGVEGSRARSEERVCVASKPDSPQKFSCSSTFPNASRHKQTAVHQVAASSVTFAVVKFPGQGPG